MVFVKYWKTWFWLFEKIVYCLISRSTNAVKGGMPYYSSLKRRIRMRLVMSELRSIMSGGCEIVKSEAVSACPLECILFPDWFGTFLRYQSRRDWLPSWQLFIARLTFRKLVPSRRSLFNRAERDSAKKDIFICHF